MVQRRVLSHPLREEVFPPEQEKYNISTPTLIQLLHHPLVHAMTKQELPGKLCSLHNLCGGQHVQLTQQGPHGCHVLLAHII